MAELSDAALNKAEAAGRLVAGQEPRAWAARYEPATARIVLDLENGCTYAFPPSLVQDLQTATASDLAQVTIDGAGFNLNFPTLDVDLSIPALVYGIFGTNAWMTSDVARIADTALCQARTQLGNTDGSAIVKQNQTPAQEVHGIISDAVRARVDRGKLRAISEVARDIGLSESRITQILRGKVARVWADELVAARSWYRRHCERQASKFTHEAEVYKLRAHALSERLGRSD